MDYVFLFLFYVYVMDVRSELYSGNLRFIGLGGMSIFRSGIVWVCGMIDY